jgi:hypothetical protein
LFRQQVDFNVICKNNGIVNDYKALDGPENLNNGADDDDSLIRARHI